MLLETKDLTIRFGGLTAVNSLNFSVEEGQIVGLIGPNGSGKTTVFNLLSGLYRPSAGEIHFTGQAIAGLKPHVVNQLGICRTFQNIRLFNSLSVYENVMIGCHSTMKNQVAESAFRLPGHRREEKSAGQRAKELIKLFELEAFEEELASNLPYGQQRRLEIVRALASQPKLLLLDEPAAGMNPQETKDLMALIRKVRALGVTILLVEHDMKLVMNICEKIVVLNYGNKIAEGRPEEIQQNEAVISAYLGRRKIDAEN